MTLFLKFARLVISLSLLLSCSNIVFSEPPNLSLARHAVIQYHDSGAYAQELNQAIKRAHAYIIAKALVYQHDKSKPKLAIVLDIDETSLSNYDTMVKRDFVGPYDVIHQEILAANATAIEPMLALYRDALKHGIKVFFVTGRRESERAATETNLINVGFTEWSGLYTRPEIYEPQSIIPFKSKARADISQQGYTIIACIGDQYSDIKGGYMEKGFKLPNPYYYLP